MYLWLLLSAAFMNIIDHLGFGCIDIVTTLQHTTYYLAVLFWTTNNFPLLKGSKTITLGKKIRKKCNLGSCSVKAKIIFF